MRKLLAPLFVFAALDVVACSVPDISNELSQTCATANTCLEGIRSNMRVECGKVADFAKSVPDRCRQHWADFFSCANDERAFTCSSKGFSVSVDVATGPCGSQLRRADSCFATTKFMALVGASETGMPPSGPVN